MNETEVLGLAQNKPKTPDQGGVQFAEMDDTNEGTQREPLPPAPGLAQSTELPLGQDQYWNQPGPTGVVSSWESGAEKQAGVQFRQNVLQGRQSLMRSRQEMEREGGEYQTQLALGDYMRSQSAEKAGWTGGYMLDQKRQGDYLRASIQAQMYGQQELQRYGMETQLEAARLAYDLGKEQLAMQLYNEAYQRAITEAGMFGYYVSPEIRDTLNQYNAALMTLEDNPEDERALQLKSTVESWFQEQRIDPNDLKTFATVTFEREQYDQAKLDAVLASIGDDPSVFLLRDANGNYSVDQDGQYIKMNFDTIGKTDFISFLTSDNGAEFAFADQTVKSYFKFLGQFTINDYLSGLGEDEVPTQEGFAAWLGTGSNNRILKYIDELNLTDEEKAILRQNIGEEISATLTSRGVTLDLITNLTASTSSSGSGATETSEAPQWNNTMAPETVVNYNKNYMTNSNITWEDLSAKYGEFGDKANKVYSMNNIAQLFQDDVNFFKDFANKTLFSGSGEPSRGQKTGVYDRFFRSHLLSGGSDPTETGVKLFAQKYGIPVDAIDWVSEKFEAPIGSGSSYGFKISPSQLTNEQIQMLKNKGFDLQGGMLVLTNNLTKAAYSKKTKNWSVDDGDGSHAHYEAGSGWNTGKWGELKVIASLMMWLDSPLKT